MKMTCFICSNKISKNSQSIHWNLTLSCENHEAHVLCSHFFRSKFFSNNLAEYDLKCILCQRRYNQDEISKLENISCILKTKILHNIDRGDCGELFDSIIPIIIFPLKYWDWIECTEAAIQARRKDLFDVLKNTFHKKFTFSERLGVYARMKRICKKQFTFWITNGINDNIVLKKNGPLTLLTYCVNQRFWDDSALIFVLFFRKFRRGDKEYFGRLLLEYHITNNVDPVFGYNFGPINPKSDSSKYWSSKFCVQFFMMNYYAFWKKFILKKIIVPVILKLELSRDLANFLTKYHNCKLSLGDAIIETIKFSKLQMLEFLLKGQSGERIPMLKLIEIKNTIKMCEMPTAAFRILQENYVYSTDLFYKIVFRK